MNQHKKMSYLQNNKMQFLNKEIQSSPSRRSLIVKKRTRVNTRCSQFKQQKQATNIQKQNKQSNGEQQKSIKKDIDNAKQEVEQSMVYKNIQIIRKVATFLQNAKMRVVKQIPKLDPIQSFYLQNEDIEQQQKDNLIPWDNILLIIFEAFFLILIFIGIWQSTYEFVLGKTQNGYITMILVLFFYLISIALTFNTELKTQKLIMISTRTQIAWIFLKEDCVFQLVAILSIVLQIASFQVFFYPERILFLASLHSALKIMKKIQDNLAVSTQIQSLIGIVKLAFKIFIFLHFLSLVLIGMNYIQSSGNSWVYTNKLTQVSNFQLYVNGYYWASTIMSTIGFGDITPGNSFERGILSFIQVFCCLFFGYNVNVIGQMIGVLGESKQLYQKDIRRLNKYLKNTRIPNIVKDKVKQHFFNRHQIEQVYDKQSQIYLFNKMTENLKTQVVQKNSIQVIQNSKFMNMFSYQTKKKIARKMIKRVYAPQQTIFDQDTQNIKLLLVQQGQVNQFCFDLANSSKKKNIAKYNHEDNTVGWSNLITGYKYRSITKSDHYTLIYELDQDQFIDILRQNKNDFIKFSEIRQKILQNQISFKKECFVCQKLTHNVVKCPRIHFIPKSMGLMISFYKTALKTLEHKRKKQFRRKRGKRYLYMEQEEQILSEQMLSQIKNQNQSSADFRSLKKSTLNKSGGRKIKRQSINQLINQSNKYAQQFKTLKAQLGMLDSTKGEIKKSKEKKNLKRRNAIFKQIVSNTIIEPQKSISVDSQSINSKYLQGYIMKFESSDLIIDKIMIDLDPNFFPKFHISSLIEILKKYQPIEHQGSRFQTMKEKKNKKTMGRKAIKIDCTSAKKITKSYMIQ